MPFVSAEHLQLISFQRAEPRPAEPRQPRPPSALARQEGEPYTDDQRIDAALSGFGVEIGGDDCPLCEPCDTIEALVQALGSLAPQERG